MKMKRTKKKRKEEEISLILAPGVGGGLAPHKSAKWPDEERVMRCVKE